MKKVKFHNKKLKNSDFKIKKLKIKELKGVLGGVIISGATDDANRSSDYDTCSCVCDSPTL
ncbi:MAG: hypothetical protein ACE5KE_02710 [Methanosarcinales archaeon]